MSSSAEILWTPSAERIERSAMAKFATAAGFEPTDYAGLHAWSVADPEGFHRLLWKDLDIIGTRGDRIAQPGADITAARFFPDASLNYAENLLRDADDSLAIIAHRDDGTRRTLTRRELAELVSRCAQALAADGVGVGDRVAGLVTNDTEAIALYLACAAIGAVWASCSPDFGPPAAADRLGQVAPKVLAAVSGYNYAGKPLDTRSSIDAIAAACAPQRIVLIGGAASTDDRHIAFENWIAPFVPQPIPYARQGIDAPMVILFSSGTTGKPKGIVHGAGRLLLQHRKEHRLHCDLRVGDRLFYYTTCGWMMWNWLVSGLASGATLVTYDGNPAWPHAARLPDLIDAEAITHFGTSARYIETTRRAGLRPIETHRLDSLRTVLSTGSPLLPEGFAHIYRDWHHDIHLASISGGTDICGCFLGGVPTRPVRSGELQGAMLGLEVAVYDGDGRPIEGRPGELVCRNAHLSMPLGFLDDPDDRRYRAAYFERFAGVWTHGDYVEARSTGYVVLGRSDATLNPGGIRIGTAEIYRQVETMPDILESVAVGQQWEGDERIVLFVRLREGVELNPELEQAIRRTIRVRATPRHVPAVICAVPDLPRTVSGKVSEIAVRAALHGHPIENEAALVNPEALVALASNFHRQQGTG
jgi:acetoacetyl-CoA synthetase